VQVEYYPPLEGAAIIRRIKASTRLIWCESPGSITMEVHRAVSLESGAVVRGSTGCGSRPSSGIAVVSGTPDMEARLYGIVGCVFRRISATVDTATPARGDGSSEAVSDGLSWGGVASLVLTPDLEAAAHAKETAIVLCVSTSVSKIPTI
jgi:hypothetical protein